MSKLTWKFTEMEKQVVLAMVDSASGNGHDFGLVEELRGVVAKDQLGAIVTNLVKKGVIEVADPVRTDSGLWTQFVWNCEERARGTFVVSLLGAAQGKAVKSKKVKKAAPAGKTVRAPKASEVEAQWEAFLSR